MQTNQLQKMELEIVQAANGSSVYIDISLPSFYVRAAIGSLDEDQGYCDTEILDAEAGK